MQGLSVLQLISIQLVVATTLTGWAASNLRRKRENRYFQYPFPGNEIKLVYRNSPERMLG
jgi:hypothetical protein